MTPAEIKAMPRRAIFVWPAGELDAGHRSIIAAGRRDILIVTPRWLRQERYRGRHISGIFVKDPERLTAGERTRVRLAAGQTDPREAKRESLARVMRQRSLTVADVADMTSRSASTVYAWLNGQNEMPDAADRLLEHEIITKATR